MGSEATHTFRRARWARGITLAPLLLVLAGCGSGSGGSGGDSPPSANGSLKNATSTVQSAMKSYLADVGGCAKQARPVVCLEAADHKLGDQIHTYANLLAVGRGFTAPQADLEATRDAAQTLANNLEILGDARPTQANYDRVLNTFNVKSAITQLQSDVTNLGASLGQ